MTDETATITDEQHDDAAVEEVPGAQELAAAPPAPKWHEKDTGGQTMLAKTIGTSLCTWPGRT